MQDLEIRPAGLDEVADLIAFWAFAAENDQRPADTPEAVERLLVRDRDATLVALVEGRVVGTVVAGWDGWRAHLYRLAVAPDVRRRGVARALLAHAERRLGDLGAVRIDAMVLDDNPLGHALWRAAGYARQDDWGRWVKPLARD